MGDVLNFFSDKIYQIRYPAGHEHWTNNRCTAARWAKDPDRLGRGMVSSDDGKTWWQWNGSDWQRVLIPYECKWPAKIQSMSRG